MHRLCGFRQVDDQWHGMQAIVQLLYPAVIIRSGCLDLGGRLETVPIGFTNKRVWFNHPCDLLLEGNAQASRE